MDVQRMFVLHISTFWKSNKSNIWTVRDTKFPNNISVDPKQYSISIVFNKHVKIRWWTLAAWHFCIFGRSHFWIFELLKHYGTLQHTDIHVLMFLLSAINLASNFVRCDHLCTFSRMHDIRFCDMRLKQLAQRLQLSVGELDILL